MSLTKFYSLNGGGCIAFILFAFAFFSLTSCDSNSESTEIVKNEMLETRDPFPTSGGVMNNNQNCGTSSEPGYTCQTYPLRRFITYDFGVPPLCPPTSCVVRIEGTYTLCTHPTNQPLFELNFQEWDFGAQNPPNQTCANALACWTQHPDFTNIYNAFIETLMKEFGESAINNAISRSLIAEPNCGMSQVAIVSYSQAICSQNCIFDSGEGDVLIVTQACDNSCCKTSQEYCINTEGTLVPFGNPVKTQIDECGGLYAGDDLCSLYAEFYQLIEKTECVEDPCQ